MEGANHEEVATVEGEYGIFAETLAQRDYGSIDETQVQIGKGHLELGRPNDIVLRQRLEEGTDRQTVCYNVMQASALDP